jgi:hypothetical protein
MLQVKPYSLSYQETVRAMVTPSTVLTSVWVGSNTPPWVSPMMSEDTMPSSL